MKIFSDVVFTDPERLTDVGSWHEHIPFMFLLMESLEPRLFVELGTHKGDSYCAFCQAAALAGLGTRCFAVDKWEGDEHAGFYDDSIFLELKKYHDARYARFSSLLRSSFDEALASFEDGTIDLLHIDGLHTYDAVRHDFESWLPKLSERAVVLFHDTAERQQGFGVWQFWQEISEKYSGLEFRHGHGLGVLLVGTEVPERYLKFHDALQADETSQHLLAALGERVRVRGELAHLQALAAGQREDLGARNESIERLSGEVRRLNKEILALQQQLEELRGVRILANRLETENGTLKSQLSVMTRLAEEIPRFREELAGRGRQIQARDRKINTLESQLQSVRDELALVYGSRSWKIAAPFRATRRVLASFPAAPSGLRSAGGTAARRVYYSLPVSYSTKLKTKDFLYRSFGVFLKDSASYRHWANQQEVSANPIRTQERPAPVPSLPGGAGAGAEGDTYQWGEFERLSAAIRERNTERIASLSPAPPKVLSIPAESLKAAAETLAFRYEEHPQVSILIPVYNNIRYTMECLHSIRKHTEGVSYEVIVVDDESADETGELLGLVDNLVYVRNDSNLGFLRTCNRGAGLARGRYLLILNNDVQVTAGWLASLVDTLSGGDDIGIVGPKIVYPNGRLQEAGGRINRDCSSQLIGVADDSRLKRFNYAREVDYCSGACLLIETERFRDMGGFDEAFAPAYCEDVDLCFRMREQGLRIVYDPDSVIVHHLSVTSDAMDDAYKTRWVVRNQQKLSDRWQARIDSLNDVRLIAFYLPQFHPIPENDLWWGKGFTEWHNVTRGIPNFEGHYQPRLPADLGFYDLRVENVMVRQAELARRYGLHGFCFYYYWFKGRRLLEMPLERMLETGKPDIPFCISWANENWTRRWDGQAHEVLMAQEHSDEDDRAVIRDMMRYLRHPNYIRINGKPFLLLYRANLFPDIRRTTDIWREVCRDEGVGEIYLAMVESFEHAAVQDPPGKYGFDASVEFPPHGMSAPMDPPGKLLNPGYSGTVHDYRKVALSYIERELPGHVRFRGVIPSWDNTARRQDHAHVFAHTSPGAYQAWLEAVIAQTLEQNFGDERIVFVNAWNEWAEGAHLEPDRQFRHGYLEATRNSLEAWYRKAG